MSEPPLPNIYLSERANSVLFLLPEYLFSPEYAYRVRMRLPPMSFTPVGFTEERQCPVSRSGVGDNVRGQGSEWTDWLATVKWHQEFK